MIFLFLPSARSSIGQGEGGRGWGGVCCNWVQQRIGGTSCEARIAGVRVLSGKRRGKELLARVHTRMHEHWPSIKPSNHPSTQRDEEGTLPPSVGAPSTWEQSSGFQ